MGEETVSIILLLENVGIILFRTRSYTLSHLSESFIDWPQVCYGSPNHCDKSRGHLIIYKVFGINQVAPVTAFQKIDFLIEAAACGRRDSIIHPSVGKHRQYLFFTRFYTRSHSSGSFIYCPEVFSLPKCGTSLASS